MKAKSTLRAIFVLIPLCGCAATGTVNYSPPANPIPPNNETTLDEPFESVWDRMVKNLSADFFVINNIERASRLMNVSFSVNDPNQYIDCGMTTRTFSFAKGEQVYRYPTAGSSQYSAVNKQGIPLNINRTTKLEGRTNIYLAPEGKKTLIRVNTRYILNIRVKGYNFANQFAGDDDVTWAFNTKEIYEQQQSESPITIRCIALGTLENKILQAAKSGS